MTTAPETTAMQRNLLISSPRTASNMLIKILNLDEQGVRPTPHAGYFWLPSLLKRYSLQSKPMREWTEEETESLNELQQQCFDKLQDYIDKANEEKQMVFVKEHALLLNHPLLESESIHGKDTTVGNPTPLIPRNGVPGTRSAHNKTSLPDEFLLTWKPTFLIRHPAMTLSSLFRKSRAARAEGEPNIIETTMRWARSLYDFYEAEHVEGSPWPLVLDADDLILHPELVVKYAGLAGLDPKKLRFKWDKIPQHQLDKMSGMEREMLDFLNASEKVDRSKVAGDIDIAKQASQWRVEFGDDAGAKLESWVRECMPDYIYLRSRRLTLDSQ